MRPLDRLSDYLGAVERRLRFMAVTRGIAATAGAALIFTVIAVLLANSFAFSKPSVTGARFLLFFGVAFAIASALVYPVIRLNRRRAAREAESRYPQFEERLLTLSEKMDHNAGDPFLHLLADDALSVAQQTEPKLTTVRQPVEAMGARMASELLALIARGGQPPAQVVLDTELVIRDSA